MQKIMFNDRYGLTDAVIEGRKIMTRRLINPMPKDCATAHKNCWGANWSDEPMSLVVDRDTGGIYCKYCGNGVRLWDEGYHYKTKYKVGEVVAVAQSYNEATREFPHMATTLVGHDILGSEPGCTNKMFVRADLMPHQIRITGIRCERLRDISDEECMKEGVVDVTYFKTGERPYELFALPGHEYEETFNTPRQAFAALIDKVSGRGTWDRNPWVVAYEFELVK